MTRILLSVLLFSVVVSGQPVSGPFVIAQHRGDHGLSNPEITLRGDSVADLFSQLGDSVFHLAVSVQSGQPVAPPQIFPMCDSGYSQQLRGVANVATGWSAVVYQLSTGNNKTRIISGGDEIEAVSTIDSGRNWASQVNPSSWNEETAIAPKVGGGFYTSWINHALSYQGSFWCELISLHITQFSTGSAGALQSTCTPLTNSNCLIRSVTTDSTIALVWREMSPFELCRITDPWDWSSVWHLTYDCMGKPLDFLATHAGRFLVLSQTLDTPGVHDNPRLLELRDNSAYDERLTLPSEPIAAVSHPDFGMAWLSRPGRGLLLSRVDTNGTVVETDGTVYWPAEDWQITNAKMAISDNGRIVAVWTEWQIPDSENTALKIASVNWDTPLAVDGSRANLQPSAFSLSAFPNPFNSEVRISFDLPHAQAIDLAVYNITGQKIASLSSGLRQAGSHTLSWQPEVGAGVYFIRLKSGSEVNTAKVLYLK